MKKRILLLMSAALIITFASCADAGNQSPDTTVADTTAAEPEQTASPLEILTSVWGSYTEEEKFPVVGGDLTEEHMTENAPGIYGLDDPAALDNSLGFPAASVGAIDDAASMIHLMNANTFTCGVYHVTNSEDMEAATAAIKDNILGRHWMCGFPEKLVIFTVNDCIVSVFGHNEPVDTFKEKLTAAFESAQLVSEDAL